jgi:hypothetical protein
MTLDTSRYLKNTVAELICIYIYISTAKIKYDLKYLQIPQKHRSRTHIYIYIYMCVCYVVFMMFDCLHSQLIETANRRSTQNRLSCDPRMIIRHCSTIAKKTFA